MSSSSLKPSVTCVEHAHLLGDRAHDVVVGPRLADRLDGPVHEDHALEAVALADARRDVVALEGGGDREDDVRAQHVVLKPGMLGHDALDLRIPEGIHDLAAATPAGDPAGGVGPHHVDLGAALLLLDGIGVPLVLVGGRLLVAAGAPELHLAVPDGLFDEDLGDHLLAPRGRGAAVRLEQALAVRAGVVRLANGPMWSAPPVMTFLGMPV